MTRTLSTPQQRALRTIFGPESFEILIEAVADQAYPLSLALPVGYILLNVTTELASGTCTVNVQKVVAGTPASVTNLSAISATATQLESTPTDDGTNVFAAGDGLQFTASANAAGVDLSITIAMQRITGN